MADVTACAAIEHCCEEGGEALYSTDAIDAGGILTTCWLGAHIATGTAVVQIRGDVDALATALGETRLARNAALPIRARRHAVCRGSWAFIAAASAVVGVRADVNLTPVGRLIF